MEKPKLAFIIREIPPKGGYYNRLLFQLGLFSRHFETHLISLRPSRIPPELLGLSHNAVSLTAEPPPSPLRWADALFAFILDGRPPFHKHYPISALRRQLASYLRKHDIRRIWAFGTLAGLVSKNIKSEYKFVDFCDSNFVSATSQKRHFLIAQSNRQFELRLARHFNWFSYICERDALAPGHANPGARVLPNPPNLWDLSSQPKIYDAIMLGNWEYPPNWDSLKFARDKILPLIKKDLKVGIIGPGFGEVGQCAGHKLDYLGAVDDLGSCLSSARMLLAPVRVGSGSSQKLLDALGASLPVLTTPFARLGVDFGRSCPGILECESPQDFADMMSFLLENPAEGRRMGSEGKKWLESSASACKKAYSSLVDEMLFPPPKRPSSGHSR